MCLGTELVFPKKKRFTIITLTCTSFSFLREQQEGMHCWSDSITPELVPPVGKISRLGWSAHIVSCIYYLNHAFFRLFFSASSSHHWMEATGRCILPRFTRNPWSLLKWQSYCIINHKRRLAAMIGYKTTERKQMFRCLGVKVIFISSSMELIPV